MHLRPLKFPTLAAALVAVFLAANAYVNFRNIAALNEEAAWVIHTHEVLGKATDVMLTVVDAETAQRGFLITAQDSFLEPFQTARSRVLRQIAELRELVRDNPRHQRRVAEIEAHANRRLDALQAAIDKRRELGLPAATPFSLAGRGKTEMDSMRAVVAELETDENQLLQQRVVDADKAYKLAASAAVLGGLAALLLLAAFWLLHRRSERARLAAAAKDYEQQEWFRTTLQSIGDAVIATDTEGRVMFINEVAQALTGWTRDAAVGQPLINVFTIFNEQTREPVESPVEKVFRIGGIVGLANHTVLVNRSGSETAIEDSAAPIKDQSGQLRGVVMVFRDASEQRSADRHRQLTEAQLRDADRKKDHFLAVLSHELRNPLAPIVNSLSLLEQAAPDSPMRAEAKATIDRQVRQMVRLVDDLLDMSRITNDKLVLRSEVVDLREVLKSAVETTQPHVDAAGQRFDVIEPTEPMYVEGDPVRLAQVFANLMNNASKFSAQGAHITAHLHRAGGDARLSVRDTGIGISASGIGQVFEMFAQLDTSVHSERGGLGIGLSLVRRLVELHGGTVTAHSEGRGLGSEFVVVLPLTQAPSLPVADSATPSVVSVENAPRRLLVVDDNEDSAASLATLLEMDGHETRTAHDGLSAVEAAADWQPDVVLLDIGLPTLNGYEAAARIRRQPHGKHVLIVAISGWGQDADRRRSQDAGIDHHLIKPIDYDELRSVIATPRRETRTSV